MTILIGLRSSASLVLAMLVLTIVSVRIARSQAGTLGYEWEGYRITRLGNTANLGMYSDRELKKLIGVIKLPDGQFTPTGDDPKAQDSEARFIAAVKSGGVALTKLDVSAAASSSVPGNGNPGLTAKPGIPGGGDTSTVTFGDDGSAKVSLSGDTTVYFKPESIEVTQPNALSYMPNSPALTTTRFDLEPGVGKQLFGSHTGIFVNGTEIKFGSGFGNTGRKGGKEREYLLKPLVEDKVVPAADLAWKDSHRPVDAPNYPNQAGALLKRVQ